MKNKITAQSTTIALIVSLLLGLGSGCCCETTHDNCGDFRLHPLFEEGIKGAIIGGIVGYQSHEEGEGAAIGAGLFVVGELLQQLDKEHKEKERAYKKSRSKTVTVEIHNDNGSITPVKLKKKDGSYIGPKGERYDKVPTEEQLKPLYGL